MHVLVLGSGGREHALCWALHQSPNLSSLHAIPGNPGIAEIATCVDLNPADPQAILAYCKEHNITMVVPGPEASIVAGVANILSLEGILVFAPTKEGAMLEASKAFTKELCAEQNIPTAEAKTCDNKEEALAYLKEVGVPIVIKADGLAAGKGVIIAMSETEATQTIEAMFSGAFGDASKRIVIEAFMEGPEISFFALCDGEHAVPFASAQDYKRVGDGGTGPNTGGMGAISPTPLLTKELEDELMATMIHPTMEGMKKRGIAFRGVLFAGIMMTKDGPRLLEYNVRFGDPETEAFLPRLKSDLLEILVACCQGRAKELIIEWHPTTTACVVMATKGYPANYPKGSVISHLDKASALDDVAIFQAGTKLANGQLTAHGGRVLDIVASGDTIAASRKKAYDAIALIDWDMGFCRSDIGADF